MTDRTILCRYDEIFLKGGNKGWFVDLLRRNVRRKTGLPRRAIRTRRGRFYVDPPADETAKVLGVLRRTFGIASASPARLLPRTSAFDAIEDEVVEVAREAREAGAGTFRITARRADKTWDGSSNQIARDLGAAVLDEVPGYEVDLEDHDLEIGVEVRKSGIYVFGEVVDGPGGLPVGCSGRGLCLLSGGIDSPVAAWMTLKRGIATDGLYFHSFPYTTDQAREKVFDGARVLAAWSPRPIRIWVPDVAEVLAALREETPERLWTVLLRRMMFRVAGRIAEREGHGTLITGEAVGQVASQTIENLTRAREVVDALVLRPLVGLDKAEIIGRAKEIGTFEISTRPHEDCCTVFVPRRPETRASRSQVEEAEAPLDVEALVEAALESTELWEVDEVGPERVEEEPGKTGEDAEEEADEEEEVSA